MCRCYGVDCGRDGAGCMMFGPRGDTVARLREGVQHDGFWLTAAECNTLLDLYESAKALHTQVEMAEAVGTCLPSRVEALSLEAAIAECG